MQTDHRNPPVDQSITHPAPPTDWVRLLEARNAREYRAERASRGIEFLEDLIGALLIFALPVVVLFIGFALGYA